MLGDAGIADTADVSCLPDVVPVCDEGACASAQVRQRALIFAVDLIPSAFTRTIVNLWQRTLFRAEIGECNLYYIPTDPNVAAADIERNYLDIVQAVKSTVKILVAVKLSPFFSNMANMAHRLEAAGADALVLFNRFYQPAIDLEELEIRRNVLLSTPQALRLPLTWIGILYGRLKAGLAATGGVHSAEDVIKLLMVGPNVTMMCSALMRHGVNHVRHVERELRDWMEEHEYESVIQM